MKVVVGCPVYERAWVLNAWFDALDDWREHIDITFFFAYTDSKDGTRDIIKERADRSLIFEVDEGDHSTERNWGERSRLETLAMLRNHLLNQVELSSPNFYFSLDSDILVAPWKTSKVLFETEYDAIAPLVYLGPGDVANAFYFKGSHHTRVLNNRRYGGEQPVDVIAAAKLMTPKAYTNSLYGYDKYGEDFFWAKGMKEAGVRLALNSSVVFKHVMDKDRLDVIDPRVGW